MATVRADVKEKVYSIDRWLGVNEAEEGEAALKPGEGSVCRNFRVTSGGALKKRGGSRRVAGLVTDWSLDIGGEALEVISGTDAGSLTFTAHRLATPTGMDSFELYGDEVRVSYRDAASHTAAARYFTSAEAIGVTGGCPLYSFADVRRRTGVFVRNKTSVGGVSGIHPGEYFLCFDEEPGKIDGAWDLTGAMVTDRLDDAVGKWVISSYFRSEFGIASDTAPEPEDFLSFFGDESDIYYGMRVVAWDEGRYGNYQAIGPRHEPAEYCWSFYPVTIKPNGGADGAVRGIWSGRVGGSEVICAACDGHLWRLSLTGEIWEKEDAGTLDTSGEVSMFGFEGKLYILNGVQYKVWDGLHLADVEGYRPLVVSSSPPSGGGVAGEPVNMLTGGRRARFSPGVTADILTLPERRIASVDYVKNLVTGEPIGIASVSLEDGRVTLSETLPLGDNTVEVGWSVPSDGAAAVRAMRFAEEYGGSGETGIFIYGDGSNSCLYSARDSDGRPRADYFPEENRCRVGDENTPITAMIRHHAKLLCFKEDSAWTMDYGSIALPGGGSRRGYFAAPVNRDVGCRAYGQARLCENRPRTLDGRSVMEWRGTGSSGNITSDQRNAVPVSQRVAATLSSLDLAQAKTFYDKLTREYYVLAPNGTAVVQNLEADAWYVYTDFPAQCMINYRGEVYYGTATGELRHFSEKYGDDCGAAIAAEWRSGAMDFGEDFRRKYSAAVWIGVKPEENACLKVTAETDRRAEFTEYGVVLRRRSTLPETDRLRLRAKKFTFYRLILESSEPGKTCTVVSADIRVRGTGYVR